GDTIASVTLSGTKAPDTTAAAGSYAGDIVPSAPVFTSGTADNYSIVVANGDLTVEKLDLTITASARSKKYGEALTLGAGQTAFTKRPATLPNGDAIVALTMSSSSRAKQASGAAGSYAGDLVPSPPVFSSGTVDNYNVVAANGTLTVEKLDLTIT